MSTLRDVSCDRVFDELTLPGESRSPAVLQHLAVCPECRALAGSIEPAVDLFRAAQSAPAIDESLRARTPPARKIAKVDAQPPHTTSGCGAGSAIPDGSAGRPGWRTARALSLFSTLAAGFLLGVLLFSGTGNRSDDRSGGSASPAPSLESLGMVAACWQGNGPTASSSVACCTRCHASQNLGAGHTSAAGGAKIPAAVSVAVNDRAMPKLLLSCQICHAP